MVQGSTPHVPGRPGWAPSRRGALRLIGLGVGGLGVGGIGVGGLGAVHLGLAPAHAGTAGAAPTVYVGVRWSGAAAGVAIRFRGPGGRVGAWQALTEGCPAGRDAPIAPAHHALVAGRGATSYELRVPPGAGGVRSAVVAGAPGPARRLPAAASLPIALPAASPPPAVGIRYVPRSMWADESLRPDDWEPTYHPVQVVTVHHTVTPNVDPDPLATVRAIHHFHTVERGWSDIGYHLLIDHAGRVYEGRWSGPDSIPGHRADGQAVTGAHVGGFNSGNVGVALLGDYRTVHPTPAARRALVVVLTLLAGAHRLDPLATVHYANPTSDARRDVATISGHGDWLATECPGGMLRADLPGIRLDVARGLV